MGGPTWSNPIRHRGWRIFHSHAFFHDFAYAHDDYDGTVDAHDHRFGHAPTIEQCKLEIDAHENKQSMEAA